MYDKRTFFKDACLAIKRSYIIKSNGKINRDGDTDWKDWLDGATKLIAQETPMQRVSFVPDIEGFLSSSE